MPPLLCSWSTCCCLLNSLFMLTCPYSKGCWSSCLSGFPLIHTVLRKHNLGPLKLVKSLMAYSSILFTKANLVQPSTGHRSHLIIGCKHQLTENCFTIVLVQNIKSWLAIQQTSWHLKDTVKVVSTSFTNKPRNVSLPHFFNLYYMNKRTWDNLAQF